MARRVVIRARKAAGFSMVERSVFCQRNQVSWTTSSASAALPSIR
jgi:hypothetical protein